MAPPPVVPDPLCFVAMPFGQKAAPGSAGPGIDFDAVYAVMYRVIEGAGLDCLRADYDPNGGFIHRSMFEALLVAEYVVVDLTFANANVAYEVGLRHGANAGRGTLLVCEEASLASLPFDFRPLRIIPYRVDALETLEQALERRLKLAVGGELPPDNPILQITSIRTSSSGHEKTDIFAKRLDLVGKLGKQVATILRSQNQEAAVQALQALQAQLVAAASQIEQLHTSLIAIYLGYRALKAWPQMVALYKEMPPELQQSAVAREQLALAHNRIAESLTEAGAIQEARRTALAVLDLIPEQQRTSETFAIRGRVFKGQADAESDAGRQAQSRAALGAAIEAYEEGLRADPRDYFPGINAVTLRILRGAPEDQEQLDRLLPVVRFALDRAPKPTNDDERYWQAATRLELATADRDWTAAQVALERLLPITSYSWMRQTTADNLNRQAKARASEAKTVQAIAGYVSALLAP